MSPTPKKKQKPLPARRPTEAVAGTGGFIVVYGYLTQVGWEPVPAAIAAAGAGAVPALVTWLRERTF